MTSILVAEDEARIASFLAKGFRAAGYAVTVVTDGRDARDYALSGEFDLMVLDLGLPSMTGFEVLASIREAGHRLPVIILTARGSVTDTVAGLDGGADDYMTKPMRFEELLARVRLRLRGDSDPVPRQVLAVGNIELDLRSRVVSVDGISIDLSAREFSLLETLMVHSGQVLSREQLLSTVWGYDFDPGSNVVDVYVGYLRKKLGLQSIVTVRGMGYRLVAR